LTTTRPPHCHITTLAAPGVRSLVWSDDGLIDWVNGGNRYGLDGQNQPRSVNYGYPFDAAIAAPSGNYAVIFTRYGTKGLILRDGALIREINRSYYCADSYEYPVALFALPNGQEVIAHCPDAYNRIEIDDLETGLRLTAGADRAPIDRFHSRLQAAPGGTRLVSAGWVWHPVDVVTIFDVAMALRDPRHLDGDGLIDGLYADASSAAFCDDGSLMVALHGDIDSERVLCELRQYDARTEGLLRVTQLASPVGTIMPIGPDFALGLYAHPHVVDLATGQVVLSYPDIASGDQTSSINMQGDITPIIACDPRNHRVAIAGQGRITVLQFTLGG
jgi:hypothetical protein